MYVQVSRQQSIGQTLPIFCSWHRDHCTTACMCLATAWLQQRQVSCTLLHSCAHCNIHTWGCGAGQQDASVTLPSSSVSGKPQFWTGKVTRAQKQHPLQPRDCKHPMPAHTTVVMAHDEEYYAHLATHKYTNTGNCMHPSSLLLATGAQKLIDRITHALATRPSEQTTNHTDP